MPHSIAVISDTHMPGRGRILPPACLERVARADLLIHAGDLCDGIALAYLGALGPPLVAVHGNVDDGEVRRHLPAERVLEVGDQRWGLIHDGGPADGRLGRLRTRFPECQGVIFGHSHIPLHQVDSDGFWILNPGSPTDRRRQPHHSMVTLRLSGDEPPVAVFHMVDEPSGELADDLIVT